MLNVMLLEHTPNPDKVIARAANQCYSEGFTGDTYTIEKPSSDAKLIEKVIAMGHTSVLEHASFTFAIEGISRACSHQLVRFRHASFSQQSQRYVQGPFDFVFPQTIKDSKLSEKFCFFMEHVDNLYNELIKEGVPAEDARFILPNASETKVVMTMNAREIYHACNLRECDHAQWEIKELFTNINTLVKPKAPITFAKLGPSCVTKGICTEGSRCCGKVNTL